MAALYLALPAQADVREPGKTDPVRKQILDGLRPVVEKELRQPVIFEVRVLRVDGNWAFLDVTPRRPNGKPIDYRRTRYRDAVEAEAFDDAAQALLHREKSGWKVKEWVLGATDVPWEGWPRKHGAPGTVLPR